MAVDKVDKILDKLLLLLILGSLNLLTLVAGLKVLNIEPEPDWFTAVLVVITFWVLTLYEGYL